MTDTLFIRLRTASEALTDAECCVAEDGVVSATERLPIAAIAARSTGRRVVAFIPSAETLSMVVALPPMSAAKARAALPYAVEDQLAGDAEDQHFALGRRLEDGRWPVRIIARTQIAQHVAALRSAGIEPQAVVAEADALHDKPGDMTLWLEGGDAHWRAPGLGTMTLPFDAPGVDGPGADGLGADALLRGAEAALGETPARMLGLRVYGGPAELARHAASLRALGERFLQVVAQSLEPSPLSWLAAQYDAAQAVNLLQGELAPQAGVSRTIDAWRWPLRLVAVVAVLQLCGRGAEAWRLQRAAAPLDEALLAATRPLDPSLRSAAAARELLRARLSAWDHSERDPARSPLLGAAATLVAARSAAPALQVMALRQHADGTVTGQFDAADADTRQRLRSTLLATGWREAPGAGADTGLSLVWSASP